VQVPALAWKTTEPSITGNEKAPRRTGALFYVLPAAAVASLGQSRHSGRRYGPDLSGSAGGAAGTMTVGATVVRVRVDKYGYSVDDASPSLGAEHSHLVPNGRGDRV